MRKNANIKSVREAIQRLMDGEIFYFLGYRMWFSDDGTAPFKVKIIQEHEITTEFGEFAKWEEKVEWYEDLKHKPRLCYVSDTNSTPNSKNTVKLVTAFSTGQELKYITDNGVQYRYATPLTDEEIAAFIY